MYTVSKLTVSDDASISIYGLGAGIALTEVDTDALAHPYNPAVVKPIHLLESLVHEYDGQNVTFHSQIIGDPKVTTPAVWCLYGRDGVNASDWNVTDFVVDEADCSSARTLALSAKVTS